MAFSLECNLVYMKIKIKKIINVIILSHFGDATYYLKNGMK